MKLNFLLTTFIFGLLTTIVEAMEDEKDFPLQVIGQIKPQEEAKNEEYLQFYRIDSNKDVHLSLPFDCEIATTQKTLLVKSNPLFLDSGSYKVNFAGEYDNTVACALYFSVLREIEFVDPFFMSIATYAVGPGFFNDSFSFKIEDTCEEVYLGIETGNRPRHHIDSFKVTKFEIVSDNSPPSPLAEGEDAGSDFTLVEKDNESNTSLQREDDVCSLVKKPPRLTRVIQWCKRKSRLPSPPYKLEGNELQDEGFICIGDPDKLGSG